MVRDGVTPRQAEWLNTIDGAARHLLGILSDILDLSKIEAGKFNLEETTCGRDPGADIASMLGERADRQGAGTASETDPLPFGCWSIPTPQAGAAELRHQRHQVHRPRPHHPAHPPGGRGRRRRAAAFRGERHRHRYRTGGAGAPVRCLRAGGQYHHPQVRRHRPGAGHHTATGATDGRPGRGAERAGRGQHFLADRPAAKAPPADEDAARRPRAWPRRCCASAMPAPVARRGRAVNRRSRYAAGGRRASWRTGENGVQRWSWRHATPTT